MLRIIFVLNVQKHTVRGMSLVCSIYSPMTNIHSKLYVLLSFLISKCHNLTIQPNLLIKNNIAFICLHIHIPVPIHTDFIKSSKTISLILTFSTNMYHLFLISIIYTFFHHLLYFFHLYYDNLSKCKINKKLRMKLKNYTILA